MVLFKAFSAFSRALNSLLWLKNFIFVYLNVIYFCPSPTAILQQKKERRAFLFSPHKTNSSKLVLVGQF